MFFEPGCQSTSKYEAKRRVRPILQDIHPPAIFAAGGHVVRHDIQQKSHAAFLQLLLKDCEAIFAAEVGIDARGIGAVVTVRAAAAAGQNRRSIDVRDAELLPDNRESARVSEIEIRGEIAGDTLRSECAVSGIAGYAPWMRSLSRRICQFTHPALRRGVTCRGGFAMLSGSTNHRPVTQVLRFPDNHREWQGQRNVQKLAKFLRRRQCRRDARRIPRLVFRDACGWRIRAWWCPARCGCWRLP